MAGRNYSTDHSWFSSRPCCNCFARLQTCEFFFLWGAFKTAAFACFTGHFSIIEHTGVTGKYRPANQPIRARDFTGSSSRHMIISTYYTTKVLGGLIQKIHQSDRAIAGLIFSMYQTGSVRIRPEIELFKMADAEEIEVCKLSPRNTKQFLSRRRRTPLWAWFGHVKQSGKTRGSCWTWKRRSHYEQQPSFNILSKNLNQI